MHNANRMTSTDLAGIIAAAATDKKARDVVILDIRGKTTIADYFVICEGDTDRQVRAITDSITDVCKAHGLRALAVAGLKDASWACADFELGDRARLPPGRADVLRPRGSVGRSRRRARGLTRR